MRDSISMARMTSLASSLRPQPRLAWQGLRSWSARRIAVAIGAAIGVTVLVGVPTVLIPNPWFGREIPPVWWNYPIWILTSVFTGMLMATYLRTDASPPRSEPASSDTGAESGDEPPTEESASRLGIAGTALTWFAVGCPVCNKLALLALGYGGAITWFAPVQPVLALTALAATSLALLARLRNQVACPVTIPASVSVP